MRSLPIVTLATLTFAGCILPAPGNSDPNDPSETAPETSTDLGPADPFDAYGVADLTDEDSVIALSGGSVIMRYDPDRTFDLVFLVLLDNDSDGGCPSVSTDRNTVTYTGGCDSRFRSWVGSMTVTTTRADGFEQVEYDMRDFGYDEDHDCDGGGTVPEQLRYEGLLERETDAGSVFFTNTLEHQGTDIDISACTSADWTTLSDYEGRGTLLAGTTESGAHSWSGSGRFAHSGIGWANVRTTDERIDTRECTTAAQSGVTELTGGGHTSEIVYDGSVACDTESTWTLDGRPQGTIAVACSNAPGSGAGLLASVVSLLLLARRRRH